MAISEKDWEQEQNRVNDVTERIEQRIAGLEDEIGDVKSDALDIRQHFWDEVTVNFSTAEDLTETFFSMKQQADVLSERERTHRQAAASLNKLRRLYQSPYFGRIDFRDAGEGDAGADKIYLGITSFRLPDSDSFLVYDWRAPVSSLYYDYPPGPAAYVTPGGQVNGELQLKRQFVIRGGTIALLFDTGVTIGDELLQQVLSRTSDAQMKSIVATIQKEQNRIIRNDRTRMLIVQGAAGSGKTSAALQRVAYLLYKHRDTLRSDQMVLFSPNTMFNSYVSSVLPELGEENMQQTTFQEYTENRLSAEFTLEDSFSQLEYVLSAEQSPAYEARLEAITYKSSALYLAVINRYIEALEKEGMLFRPVKFNGKVIVSSEQIKDRFYTFDSSIKLANRVVLLRDWLLHEIGLFEKRAQKEAWVEEEIQLLDSEAYQRAYYKLRKQSKNKEQSFDDYDVEQGLLAKMVVAERLKPIRRRINSLRFVDVRAIYRQLFTDRERMIASVGTEGLPALWNAVAAYTVERLDEKALTYEDITPYLFLNERLKGFRTNTSVRYVLIDEAQDYSPFQLEFLKWLFPRARMTALGDLNQAIYAGTSAMAINELNPLTALYGPEETEMIALTRSYRSTREIVLFTRGMVPGGSDIIPFNREGDKPLVERVRSESELHEKLAASIGELVKEGYDSIAIICKTEREAKAAYDGLNGRLPLRLVTKHTPSFEKGIQIIPSYLAKGVEFDAVMIYNGSADLYRREGERKLFYTACTRAMHLLHIYVQGEISPFIAEQPAETYVVS
jgi:DNA helicase-2/ATP-dependent DNA helicase PcrA